MTTNRVLSEYLRPKCLDDLIGLSSQVDALKRQFASSRVPHFFILSGPSGSGKTTLAKIIAQQLLCGSDISKKSEVRVVNASDKNGVDDVRFLIDGMRFQPLPPYKNKVIIFDEAHQLTPPAQNALLTVTEDAPTYAYYIFCTTAKSKILPALQRRAYVVCTTPLEPHDVRKLLDRAWASAGRGPCSDQDIMPLVDALHENGIYFPGIVLQAAEHYITGGQSAEDAVCSVSSASVSCNTDALNKKLDTMTVCRAVVAGNWKVCAAQLSKTDINRNDVYPLKACVLGYLKKVLLGSNGGAHAISTSKAINHVANSVGDEVTSVPALFASLALACEQMKQLKTV